MFVTHTPPWKRHSHQLQQVPLGWFCPGHGMRRKSKAGDKQGRKTSTLGCEGCSCGITKVQFEDHVRATSVKHGLVLADLTLGPGNGLGDLLRLLLLFHWKQKETAPLLSLFPPIVLLCQVTRYWCIQMCFQKCIVILCIRSLWFMLSWLVLEHVLLSSSLRLLRRKALRGWHAGAWSGYLSFWQFANYSYCYHIPEQISVSLPQ